MDFQRKSKNSTIKANEGGIFQKELWVKPLTHGDNWKQIHKKLTKFFRVGLKTILGHQPTLAGWKSCFAPKEAYSPVSSSYDTKQVSKGRNFPRAKPTAKEDTRLGSITQGPEPGSNLQTSPLQDQGSSQCLSSGISPLLWTWDWLFPCFLFLQRNVYQGHPVPIAHCILYIGYIDSGNCPFSL